MREIIEKRINELEAMRIDFLLKSQLIRENKIILSRILGEDDPEEVKNDGVLLKRIFNDCCVFLNQSPVYVLKKTRKREAVFARHLFHIIAKRTTKESNAEIGDVTGKDHSTVTHSVKRYNNDYTIKAIVDEYCKSRRIE